MTGQPYQLLPPLTGEEYSALRDDIAANGIRVPVDVDEDGQVLDGHHRQQIAAELGIPCPTRVVAGLTEDEKRHHALAVNLQRRTLTREQRRKLVAAELERDPSRSDRAIGRLTGVDHKTVAAIRRGGWGIPHPEPLSRQEAEDITAAMGAAIAREWAQIDAHTARLLRLPGATPALIADLLRFVMLKHVPSGIDDGGYEFLALWREAVEPRVAEILRYPAGAYGRTGAP